MSELSPIMQKATKIQKIGELEVKERIHYERRLVHGALDETEATIRQIIEEAVKEAYDDTEEGAVEFATGLVEKLKDAGVL